MLVRILRDIDYTPTATDSPRCYGQLRYRQAETKLSFENGQPKLASGPAVLGFFAGATPDLADDVAMQLIAAGDAEPVDAMDIRVVSRDEILKDVRVEAGAA